MQGVSFEKVFQMGRIERLRWSCMQSAIYDHGERRLDVCFDGKVRRYL